MRKPTTPHAEIKLFSCVATPVGHYFWDPSRATAAFLAGSLVAGLGVFLSASLSLGFDSGFGTAFFTLLSSALLAIVATVKTLSA